MSGLIILLFLMESTLVRGSVLEFLESNIWCRDVQSYIVVDHRIWTSFLSSQPGFIRKEVMTNPRDPVSANCTVTQTILWESRELWKSVDPKQLVAVDALFVKEFGYEPLLTAKPTDDGYDVYTFNELPSSASDGTCKNGKLCLLISDAAFYAILAVVLVHVLQAAVWAVVSKRKRLFSARSFFVVLFVPVVGLVMWLQVCRSPAATQRQESLLSDVRRAPQERE
jgi:uncharacterized protein (TIGR03792 family)